eukprot:jgi/Mesen1/5975/ME000302S04974
MRLSILWLSDSLAGSRELKGQVRVLGPCQIVQLPLESKMLIKEETSSAKSCATPAEEAPGAGRGGRGGEAGRERLRCVETPRRDNNDSRHVNNEEMPGDWPCLTLSRHCIPGMSALQHGMEKMPGELQADRPAEEGQGASRERPLCVSPLSELGISRRGVELEAKVAALQETLLPGQQSLARWRSSVQSEDLPSPVSELARLQLAEAAALHVEAQECRQPLLSQRAGRSSSAPDADGFVLATEDHLETLAALRLVDWLEDRLGSCLEQEQEQEQEQELQGPGPMADDSHEEGGFPPYSLEAAFQQCCQQGARLPASLLTGEAMSSSNSGAPSPAALGPEARLQASCERVEKGAEVAIAGGATWPAESGHGLVTSLPPPLPEEEGRIVEWHDLTPVAAAADCSYGYGSVCSSDSASDSSDGEGPELPDSWRAPSLSISKSAGQVQRSRGAGIGKWKLSQEMAVDRRRRAGKRGSRIVSAPTPLLTACEWLADLSREALSLPEAPPGLSSSWKRRPNRDVGEAAYAEDCLSPPAGARDAAPRAHQQQQQQRRPRKSTPGGGKDSGRRGGASPLSILPAAKRGTAGPERGRGGSSRHQLPAGADRQVAREPSVALMTKDQSTTRMYLALIDGVGSYVGRANALSEELVRRMGAIYAHHAATRARRGSEDSPPHASRPRVPPQQQPACVPGLFSPRRQVSLSSGHLRGPQAGGSNEGRSDEAPHALLAQGGIVTAHVAAAGVVGASPSGRPQGAGQGGQQQQQEEEVEATTTQVAHACHSLGSLEVQRALLSLAGMRKKKKKLMPRAAVARKLLASWAPQQVAAGGAGAGGVSVSEASSPASSPMRDPEAPSHEARLQRHSIASWLQRSHGGMSPVAATSPRLLPHPFAARVAAIDDAARSASGSSSVSGSRELLRASAPPGGSGRGSPTEDTSAAHDDNDEVAGHRCVDPYGVFGDDPWQTGATFSDFVEVTHVPTGDRLRGADAANFLHFRMLLEQLDSVQVGELGHEQKLAFWINMFNALAMHAYILYGAPDSYQAGISILGKAACNIEGHEVSALSIEHLILRAHSHCTPVVSAVEPASWKGTRGKWMLHEREPLVTFALCSGAFSAPPLRVYTAAGVHSQLEAAKRAYLRVAVAPTLAATLVIPKLLSWYCADFARDTEELMRWVAGHLPMQQSLAVELVLSRKRWWRPLSRGLLAVAPYDWRFRYLLVSDALRPHPAREEEDEAPPLTSLSPLLNLHHG